MEALRDRLKELENASGSDIWEIIKESETSLQRDLSDIKQKQVTAQERGKQTLDLLEKKKLELTKIRNEIVALRGDYAKHRQDVVEELVRNGLNFENISSLVQNQMEELVMNKKSEIINLKDCCLAAIKNKDFEKFKDLINKMVEILKENKTSSLHEMVISEISDASHVFSHYVRSNLWSFLHQHNLPIKPLKDSVNLADLPVFFDKLNTICNISSNLDYIFYSNNSESIDNITTSFFGQLTDICVDIVEKDSGENDLGWIFSCAYKWSRNLKEIVFSALKNLSFSNETIDDKKCETIFNKKFVLLIHRIIRVFINKNFNDPLVFSMLSSSISKFEEEYDVPLLDMDLYEPLYDPEVLHRRIMLEFEIFSMECKNLLNNERCFDRLIPSINVEMKWASEVSIFFEEWITRLNKEIISMSNLEVQNAFHDALRVMMLDLITRIQETANRLYMEPTWANDVYLVMNSVWELRKMIEEFTISWPVSTRDIQEAYESEWNRLADMIAEYLKDIIDTMDTAIRASYSSNSEKIRKINVTFNRIIKCISNVAMKASKSSRSDLLNKLLDGLFTNLQQKSVYWQNGSVDVVSAFYTEIYSNFLPYLNALEEKGIMAKEEETRNGITQLDALMKVAASKDPSGELVRTAFKSIDEEQVVKMLSELGIKSTSDHAFQDYQILAENWGKVHRNVY